MIEFPPYPEIDVAATGTKIRVLREQSGISVDAFARYLHLSGTRSVYYWFSGKTLPSVDNLFAMSRLFQVTINNILVEKAA